MDSEDLTSSNVSSGQENLFTKQSRNIDIVVHTVVGQFKGTAVCQPQQRLLDALNKGFAIGKAQTSIDFIPITNVVYTKPDTSSATMDVTYIRKKNVLYIAEIGGRKKRGVPLTYPFREKKGIRVVINLAAQSLTGLMYGEMWEELQEALNRTDQFIPLTDVTFNPPPASGPEKVNFVAVNKDYIIYAGSEE